ncbi:MAG: ATP phosphoribosyltransferase [Fimbriimonadales bacterium]|nr:ATP phosphoribosyltransferase [Fimbriimonadales bacterium]CUU38873.1 ATP phosphoribosyltransferase (homohexameric) [Armatimonadetes bacterium GXS]
MQEPLKIKLGLPKGSLQEATFALFKKAGWNFHIPSGRSYEPVADDPEIEAVLLRPQEIPLYVQDGVLDAGITGYDWIQDCGAQVHEVLELQYSKSTRNPIRVVLAVHNDAPFQSVKDLEGKRIATEYVRLTQRYLEQHGVQAHVEFSWGACEVKVPHLVDAIVVNTETGSSLRAHNLRILAVLLYSTTRLIANPEAWANPAKREKIESIALMLQGALNAGALVGLKMNVHESCLDAVLTELPALRKPTLAPLSDKGWYAVDTIIEERVARDLIPRLRKAGAEGLVEYPLNKVIP